jgi:hypothetical protein
MEKSWRATPNDRFGDAAPQGNTNAKCPQRADRVDRPSWAARGGTGTFDRTDILPGILAIMALSRVYAIWGDVGFVSVREAGWASPLLTGTLGDSPSTWGTFAPCFA